MNHVRISTIGILCGLLGVSVLCAGDFSSYRGMEFGTNLATATKQAGTKLSDVRLVHQRPALIQEMDWQPLPVQAVADQEDPVRNGQLYFFNGELFRIVINYDRYKVEGMTTADMIEGISAHYGVATTPAVEIPYHSIYGETAAVIARWEDSEYSYNLIRSGDRSSFTLILYSKRLDALAQTAITEAVRLDVQEAPQRELEKQRKRDGAEQLVLEKARSANKPNFRP
jgi:hypothetical protein